MATITIQDEQRTLKTPAEITAFLTPFGIEYEQWHVDKPVDPDASAAEILDCYAAEVDRLKREKGYLVADVINVTPQTPNLDAMLEKFKSEHTHAEDEVRFIVKGSGVFHIHPENGPIFGLQLDAGDLINVPAGIKHWFDLCEDRQIRAIRLFKEPSGWTPEYTHSGIHAHYTPVCWGPNYLPADKRLPAGLTPVVQP